MEQLFNSIQTRIAEGMPELSLTDEDYGQLDTNEDTYPVTFPCALISAPEIEWKGEGPVQQGACNFSVKLVIDCYDDTHYSSGTADKIAERQQLNNKLNILLHLFKIEGMGSLVRVKSNNYTIAHGIKVYETLYRVLVFDRPA